MEAVLSQLTPCPHCVVTDHGSPRPCVEDRETGGEPAEMLPSSAKSCHHASARSPSRNETVAGWT